jgi:outer membrane autotransporter protein
VGDFGLRAYRRGISGLLAALAAGAALWSAGPANAVIVRDDVGLTASQDPTNVYSPVVQLFFLDNLTGDIFFDCTGTLINPRTVITAAHCVNFLGSEDYNLSLLGFSMLVAGGPNTQTRIFNFALNGFNYAQGGAAISVDVIVHPASNLENFALPFPFGDVALIALAEPITDLGRMDILLSPMPGPYHATIAAYGGFGVGSTGDVGIGFNRIVGENMVDMLGSFNDLFTATTGANLGFESQNLYWIDMDDPDRPTAPVQCVNNAGVLGFPACTSVAAFQDINWFGGDALAREAGTAGGDSGSALIVDQAFARKLVAGVLSGGWNWNFFYPGLGVPGGYGDQSYYNPLYLYHEFISQNTPYKYVSAVSGGGDWDNPATWTQELDPGFFVIDAGGQLVNGIPAGAEPGVGGTTPKWGDVQGTDISGFDPTPNPGLPFSTGGDPLSVGATDPLPAFAAVPDPSAEGAGLVADLEAAAGNITDPRALADLVPPSTTLLGPGSTNFVPHNTFGTPGIAFQNPALFFEVWLNRPGTVTLSSLKDIDRLELNHDAGRLWIQDTGGDLLTVIETMILAGELTVDGNLFSPSVVNMFGGRIDGHGFIVSPLVENYARLAPGNSIGTLTIVGDFVQGPTGLLEIELTDGASDVLDVTGNALLSGGVQFSVFGASPLEGQNYNFLVTGGTVSGQFGVIQDLLPGGLFPVVTYGANFVNVEVRALCTNATGPLRAPVCAALVDPAVETDPDMATALGQLQMLAIADEDTFLRALDALNPTRAHAQAIVGLTTGDLLRNQFGRRTHDLLGGVSMANVARRDVAGAQLAAVSPSSDMLASAAAAALDSGEGGGSNVALPNGHAMFFAADIALTETDQPAGIGEDEADVAALTAGLDHSDGTGMIYGAALSYLQANVAQNYGFGGKTASDGVAISGYGNFHRGLMYADMFASYAWHDFETERGLLVGPGMLSTAEGTTSASQILAGATLGYGLNTSKRLSFGAVAGLHYINLDIDGYSETGSPLAAVIPSRTIDSLKGQIGGEMSFQLEPGNETLVPILRVVWNHEFMDDALLIRSGFAGAPATTFDTPGPELGTDWATVGFGFSGRVSDGTSFYFRYQHDLGRDGHENQEVSAAARMAF